MCSELFLSGSANGANVCTVTARDALISIDYELAVTLGNATGGAAICACAASDALITNLESHCKFLRKNFWQGNESHTYIVAYICKKSRVFRKKNQKYLSVGRNICIKRLVIVVIFVSVLKDLYLCALEYLDGFLIVIFKFYLDFSC